MKGDFLVCSSARVFPSLEVAGTCSILIEILKKENDGV